MSPEHGGGGQKPRVAAAIPTSWETAINDLRKHRYTESDLDNPPSKASIVRDSVELYLAVLKVHGLLPPEAQDDVSNLDAEKVLAQYGLTVQNGTLRSQASIEWGTEA